MSTELAQQLGLPVPATSDKPTANATKQARSKVNAILPTFDAPLVGGFERIPVPASYGGADPTTSHWFPIVDVDIGQMFGQDVYLFKMKYTQLPTDNDTAGGRASDEVLWGDATGTNAAIVVGVNLFPAGQTTIFRAPCPLPGVGTSITRNLKRFIDHQYFPGGAFTDAFKWSRTLTVTTSPVVVRLPQASRLQAAVVISGASTGNVTASPVFLRGHGSVSLFCANTINDRAIET